MNYKNFINNEWFDSDSGRTFEVVNPFTETVIAKVPASGKSDVDKAVRAAQTAFKDWGTMTAGDRRDYLQALAQKSLAHADSLAKTISIEMGKPLKDAITEIEDLQNIFSIMVSLLETKWVGLFLLLRKNLCLWYGMNLTELLGVLFHGITHYH